MILFQKKFSLVLAVIASSFMSTLFAQQTALLGQAPAVTISEYTDFLNCVAATDTYSLYNVKMGGEEGIAPIITRSGNPGSYTYSYNADKASCPITYVSWISAVRYCNWKSHHSPIGLQGTTTTETGSYDLTAFDQGADISTIILTPGANFFLPTNYLVDTTFQESNTSSCNHYLASSRFGFCIGTWTVPSSSSDASNASGNSLSQVGAGGTSASTSSGTSSGSTTISALKVSEATVTNVPSTTDSLLINTATNTNTNQINISLVVVGAPNNSADVSPSGTNKAATNQVGYGSVLMPYSIGTYDVTAYEYCAFLNAVAGKSDPHQLYNTNMTSDPDVACITRSGDANSGYTYTPISGREKFPITYVSWYSALRFCNWLENGQPT